MCLVRSLFLNSSVSSLLNGLLQDAESVLREQSTVVTRYLVGEVNLWVPEYRGIGLLVR